MDYILIFFSALLGTGFHVMQKINQQRIEFPQFKPTEIWTNFLKEEWDSLIVSALILIAQELAVFIIQYNGVKLPVWVDNWGMYIISCVISYGGQRLAYKYLNTSVDALEKKADTINNKLQ